MKVVLVRTRLSDVKFDSEKFERELLTDVKGVAVQSLREFARLVRKYTKQNIRRGAQDSKYPQSGALARSFHYEVKSRGSAPVLVIEIGEGLPYGANINADRGDITPIWSNGPAMSFFWYKIGRPMRINKPGYIKYEGKAFLSEAFDQASTQLDDIVERIVEQGI